MRVKLPDGTAVTSNSEPVAGQSDDDAERLWLERIAERTKSGLPKNCVWTMDRENGKRRVRFRNRKAGFSAYLTGTPWSDEFMRQ